MATVTGVTARSIGTSSSRCSPATAHATATGWRRGARRMTRVPGCGRRRQPSPTSAGTASLRKPPNRIFGDCDGHTQHAFVGSLHSQPQRARAQALRLAACVRRHHGAASRARHLHSPRRGPVDLGSSVERDHGVRPVREGHDVRAGGIQDLPPPDVLRRTRRSRAYVMATASIQVSETPLVLYVLRRADDALILGHRLSEWCGHAPMLEEDMALANMGLDLLGQARELYTYAAKVEGGGNDEDKFAYLRDVRQYHNLLLLEQPNGDFARTMVRQFFYSAFADLYWCAMMKSTDTTLAAIAAKSEKESAYHLRHSSEWMLRLGDGTDESHVRAQTAIDDLWSFTGEMFAVDDSERGLIDAGIAIDPAGLKPQWLQTVSSIVAEATLALPTSDWMQQGGRFGRHSEHLGHLLSDLQYLQRAFPGATW